MAWVDIIKGTSVVLVVFMHVVLTLQAAAPGSSAGTFWGFTTTMLEPLRMPVFFVVSGMLAASAVHRPWSQTQKRTLGIGYLYVVWTAVLIAVIALSLPPEGPLAALSTFPSTLLVVASGYWYLFALVLFFVIARIFRNAPAWAVLAVAAVPNVLRPVTTETIGGLHPNTLAPAMAMNLVFFLAGAYYKNAFAAITRLASWTNVAVLATVLVTAGVWRFHTQALWDQTFLPLSIGWIVLAIMTGHLLTQYAGPRSFGSFMGARTLPIFVMQFPLLYLISRSLEDHPTLLANPVVQFGYPVAMTAALVLLALALYSATQGTKAWLLFEAPARLTSLAPRSAWPALRLPSRQPGASVGWPPTRIEGRTFAPVYGG